ncbi:MAG: COQ9 family protein, partial [Paracoccaceae bacterium]
VAFDGWSAATFKAAIADSDMPPGLARAIFPRGGVDLALAYHQRGNDQMRDALATTDLGPLRFRDRIAAAVKLRLAQSDPEVVRRGVALFALPQHAADGTKAIWGTADAIWAALGDTSDDVNWYTKRASLSAVYGSTVLYWLGDDSAGHQPTWDFLDRRIDNVMSFEKAKAALRDNPVAKAMMAGPMRLLNLIHAPKTPPELPGRSQRSAP